VVSLPVLLLLPGVELEEDSAVAIVANIDNESRLNPMTESETISMALLLLLLIIIPARCVSHYLLYKALFSNKQFNRFIVKVFTNFVLSF
jgi:hypothetical protein